MARGRPYKGRRITTDLFAAVIRDFLLSDKFRKLAPKTQESYRYNLVIAHDPDTLGPVPVDEMRPSRVQSFLDGYSDRPAAQKVAQTALKSMERWAIVRDRLPLPITMGTEAVGSTGGHIPWEDEHVRLAEQHSKPHISQMVTL